MIQRSPLATEAMMAVIRLLLLLAAVPTHAAPVAQPLYRDPVHDGAADPAVVWNPHAEKWWMFYTNRRARDDAARGVAWVHRTRIGIAESADRGATWKHAGEAAIDLPDRFGGAQASHWAPEVLTAPDGEHHMFLSVVPGTFEDWNHPRSIVHLTSRDLRRWSFQGELKLASDRVIDACVHRLPDGTWRMWYNNEPDHKAICFADSPDLRSWTDRGKAIGDRSGEGPKVFRWKGWWWMITDVWDGLGVYRSNDALAWTRMPANLLRDPGTGPDDQVKGGHPDVVVAGDRAFLFYFTHPGRIPANEGRDNYETRRSSILATELTVAGNSLGCDRNSPPDIALVPPASP